MNVEKYHRFVGVVFVVTEQIGVIPKGCRLYCFSQSGDYLNVASSVDICGVRHLKLHVDHVNKLNILHDP